MKYVLVALIALVLGGLAARVMWREEPEPVDPLQVIVTQLKTHAIIEHERQIAIWYRTCPNVLGVDPQIFVAWPAKLSYELELDDVTLKLEGTKLVVQTAPIHADEPSVPTDFVDYLSTDSLFTFANEQELINREVAKASMIARYLSAYFMKRDASLQRDFIREIEELIERISAALGVTISEIQVDVPGIETQLPKLPKLELCAGSAASVNGLPFARVEDGFTVPIGFQPVPSVRSADEGAALPAGKPQGIASVYGKGEQR